MKENLSNFDEDNYRALLNLAKSRYKFVPYDDFKSDGHLIFWRHDIDFSVHRAMRIAYIEQEADVQSTYFIDFHSEFYNVSERKITCLLNKILTLGHDLGLHFNVEYYASKIKSKRDLAKYIKLEINYIRDIFGIEVKAFSFHNPTTIGGLINLDDEYVGGLINTYSSYFSQVVGYCSDSNGYWRFEPLHNVLESRKYRKLQVLTHPGWWLPKHSSPRDRVLRCVYGRADALMKDYDELLEKYNRRNIGK